MDGRRIRVWLSLFGGESGAAVAEEKEANGSRLRPNRNSIDLVRWCQAIHLAPSVRRRVFYGSASRFPRFSTALPRLRPSLGAGRGREKKTGQLSGRPPNCSLITVPVITEPLLPCNHHARRFRPHCCRFRFEESAILY